MVQSESVCCSELPVVNSHLPSAAFLEFLVICVPFMFLFWFVFLILLKCQKEMPQLEIKST